MKNFKIMKSGLLVLITFISIITYGQTDEQIYGGYLLELEQNISSKAFLKVWKNDKKTWEAECKSATTVKELTELTQRLATVSYVYRQVRPMLVTEESLYAQSGAILMLKNILTEDLLKWSEQDQAAWKNNVESFKSSLEAKEKVRLAEQRKVKVAEIMLDFKEKFNLILEDSKKGSFANTIDGEKSGSEIKVKVFFTQGENARVNVDGDNIYTYSVEFSVNTDEELAKETYKEMLAVINENVPSGYEETTKYDGKYYKSQASYFEFKAEKFALTAKQPSVLLGLVKDFSSIELQIQEPVFKR